MPHLGDVKVLYLRELRSALRERAIVVNSLLIPIFMYPVMLWLMFTGIVFVQGLAEGFDSRIAVRGLPAEHAEILDTLEARDEIEVRAGAGGDGGAGGDDAADAALASADSALGLVREGDLDALVEFLPPAPEGEALPGNFRVRVHYDGAIERSRRAEQRVREVVDDYRARWLAREAERIGISEAELEPFRVDRETVSTEREMGALILSEMIPLFLVIMVAFGCFYPAIDATAGERERSTWETLMTVSASRMSVVTAKYLYVATLGVAAGILNVLAMFASVGAVLRPLLASEGAELTFSFPPMAVPLMIAGAVVLGLFFAAAMMILAAFARTFKEGQGMITPVFWLVFLPLVLGSSPDRTLTPTLALVPVANVAQMIKDAIRGVYLWPLIAQTLLVEVALVVLCLLVARWVLRFEDFLLGSHGGSFWSFMKGRTGKEKEAR